MLQKEAVRLLLRSVSVFHCDFFATGTYLHTVGDAENISKNTVCLAIRKVVAALNTLPNMFVVFPSFLPTQTVKEGFYQLAGKRKHLFACMSGTVEVARPSCYSACWVCFPSEVHLCVV